MAQTTYEVTIPHTSLEVDYSSSDWFANCPIEDGKIMCGNENGTVVGTHNSTVATSTFGFKFYGTALYLYGEADDGMNLTITFNYASTTAIPLTPSGGMLASIDDFTLLCSNSYSCYDRSIPSTYSTPAYAYNEFVITATQYRERASVRFSKGVYNYPTRRIGATTSLVQYSNTDPRISFTTGWTRNGTYTQAGVVSTQTFTMMFDGPAIWIWAFCGRRSGGYDSSSYGTLTLNGRSNYAYISSAEQYGSNNTPQDGKCLIWFKGNLNNTANTLTFDSERHNFMLHSIDVLNVQGGEIMTTTTSGYSFSFPTASSISGGSTLAGQTNGTSYAGLIAGPVVAVIIALAIGIGAAIYLRKRNKQKALATGDAAAAGAGTSMGTGSPFMGPSTYEYKTMDSVLNTPPSQPGYLTYTPPPPATPHPARA
ncbi:hypothetical protein FRC20_001808 [Serendipita sp. 405]|nr:hypothetical protein FRC20_001808 [Serendipita sp. 405]